MPTDPSAHQRGIINRYYEHHDTIQSNKLGELLSELYLVEDEKRAMKLWGKAQTALMRMGVDANQAAKIAGDRDIQGLAKLIGDADAGRVKQTDPEHIKTHDERRAESVADGRTIKQMQAEQAAAGGFDSLDEENLKRAVREFKRKLKTMRRDDESRLGSKYVTSGRGSGITAIAPPNKFPPAVWAKLVELGRLKRVGKGLYELP